ncbi:MAG: hypothetical protein GY950_10540 [bacterium]|nr:hypothetical protein [bacterium]
MGFFELDDVFGYQDANNMRKLWAAGTPPVSPGEGEVWLDTNANPCRLKRYNGSAWETVAAVRSGTSDPVPAPGYTDSMVGELFLNTSTTPPVLKCHNGSTWEIAMGYSGIRKDLDDSFSGTLTSTIGTETAVKFGIDSCITIHDGYGNFNIKSGVDDDNIITGVAGGSHIRLDHVGRFYFNSSSSTVGQAFSSDSYIIADSAGIYLYGTAVAGDELRIPTSRPASISNGSLWIE